MVVGAVHRLHHQPIASRRQILDLHHQPSRYHRIPFLDEGIRGSQPAEHHVFVRRAFINVIRETYARWCRGSEQRLVNLRIHDHVIAALKAIARRRHHLHSLDHQRHAILQQRGIQSRGNVRDTGGGIRERHAAEAEILAVVRINLQRRFKFPERIAASAEHHGQLVSARRRIELVLIAVRNLGELFPLVLFQIEINGIAEARAHRTIRFVGHPQNIHVGAILAFFFVEVQRFRGNLHRQIHARHIRRGVEIGRPQRAMNRANLRARRVQLQLLFHRLAFQRIRRPGVAISATRAHIQPAAVQLHLQRVAAALRRFRRHVPHDIKLTLLAANALEPTEQVIGVEDGKAARPLGERRQNLLVGGHRRRQLRNKRPRLIVGIVQGIVVGIAGVRATAAGPASGAAGSTLATCSASATGSSLATCSASATGSARASGAATTSAASSAGATRPAGSAAASTASATAASPAATTAARTLWLTHCVGCQHQTRACRRNLRWPCLRGVAQFLPAHFVACAAAANGRRRNQSAYVQRIDRYVGLVAGVDGRGKLGFILRRERKSRGEKHQHLAARHRPQVFRQAAHRKQHGARAVIRLGVA